MSITIDRYATGIIESDSQILGSGFILDSPHQIITCAHVVKNHPKLFYSSEASKYELKLDKIDEVNDIAFLSCEHPACKTPLTKVKSKQIENGQEIVYIGYDSNESNKTKENVRMVHRATIIAYGSQLSKSSNAKFIDFIGNAKPGYSGGPVFNSQGEIIALITAAWIRRDLKVGEEVLFNRAFLIE